MIPEIKSLLGTKSDDTVNLLCHGFVNELYSNRKKFMKIATLYKCKSKYQISIDSGMTEITNRCTSLQKLLQNYTLQSTFYLDPHMNIHGHRK